MIALYQIVICFVLDAKLDETPEEDQKNITGQNISTEITPNEQPAG